MNSFIETITGIYKKFSKILKGKGEHFVPTQIASKCNLQKWLENIDLTLPEKEHSHIPHLYGLFPSSRINHLDMPELFDAARKSLDNRSDGGTKWSKAWKINFRQDRRTATMLTRCSQTL